jgi:hypothetical protein
MTIDPWADLYVDPKDEPPISKNIFAKVPYDVLQHVLSPLLTPLDRANFNEVLEPTERIYKRFPKDYSLKHHLLMLRDRRNAIVKKLKFFIEGPLSERKYVKAAFEQFHKLLRFIREPRNRVVFRHVPNLKTKTIEMLWHYCDEDIPLHVHSPSEQCSVKFIKELIDTIEIVESVPFERTCGLNGFKPVYSVP